MFFFGFLSSVLPYLATFVVMGLYILIGQPNKEEVTSIATSIQISIDQDLELQTASTTIEYQQVLELTKVFPSTFKHIGKDKILRITPPNINQHSSSLGKVTSNKAPPVLA